jgi:hypothetical protein
MSASDEGDQVPARMPGEGGLLAAELIVEEGRVPVALAGLLYLVISNLSGASQVWASLVTVAVVVGSGTWGLGSGVSQALGGVGYEIWSAAKLDASAWGVTWLPALTASTVERARLEVRGVAMPQIRKNLDR